MAKNEDESFQVFKFVTYDPPYIPRFMLDVMAQDRVKNYALELRVFDQIYAYSVEKNVRGLPVPALIVWGDKDRVLSVASAGVLHQLMPRSQVVIMPGIGHLPMMERPRQSAENYLKFRASL